jgi:hypothetical protein
LPGTNPVESIEQWGKSAMIEDVIRLVVARLRASTGDNLLGFLYDAEHALAEVHSAAFSSVEIFSSQEPTALVKARLVVSPIVATLQEVSQALSSAFQFVAYNHFQASALKWYREATVLRFVTVMSADIYVTGWLTVAGAHYPRLIEAFERDFGALHGPILTCPDDLK